jgi:Fe-S-cluster containining protein
MDARLEPLDTNASFKFCCSPQTVCFNECCRDLNQFLTPYDVARLKNRLRLSSGEFLARYTRRHTGPGTGLPIVTLIPAGPERLTCPFVTPAGCSVYPDRPSSCRTYPLVRMLRRSRGSDEIIEEYRLLKEPHCQGFEAAHLQTVREWIANQGLADYNAENDRLLQVIGLKTRLSSKALPPSLADQVYMAFYDLDRFRERLCSGSLDLAGLPAELIEPARQDDTALLRLGLEWVKQLLKKTLAR